MIFAHPHWLWLLLAVPLLALLEWHGAGRADRALPLLVGSRAGHPLLGQRLPGARRRGVVLRLVALTLLVTGAAGPEWGREAVRRSSSGSDIVFLIDVSSSMDARDVAPSRLDEARREALGLVERLQGSRVGVVAFAGDAVRVCPLTLDPGAVRMVLDGLSTTTVSDPGTDLGRGLRTAAKLLPSGRREEQAIVLWTDGEDLEGHAEAAVREVARTGVRVFAVGVGTAGGDVIPTLDEMGHPTGVKQDENGETVRSRLDETTLRALSRATRGAYFAANRPGGELPRLVAAMGALARSRRGTRLIERPVARFPWFALAAGVALLAERARRRRRRGVPGRTDEDAPPAAPTAAAAASAALLGLVLFAPPARAQSDWARGDAAYKAGRFAEAESLYARRARRGAPAALQLDLATARARAGNLGDAVPVFDRLQADRRLGGAAGYNLGTLFGGQDRIEEGLAALRRTLERDPGDADARYNYEVLLQRRRQQQQQQQPQPGQGPPPPQPPQNPQPSPAAQNPNSGQPPQPQGGDQPPPPNGPEGNPPPSGAPQQMSKAQAERLLGSLAELERAEQQQRRRVRAVREKHGRDW